MESPNTQALTELPAGDSQAGAHPAYRHCYVHVPFCARRCSYCDFAIAVRKTVPTADYVRALHGELMARGFRDESLPLNTLYFGGGTPSSLGGEGVRNMVTCLREFAHWHESAEITLEANPEDFSGAAVSTWRSAGINRLSIGVQSFDDNVLQWMRRVHNAESAKTAVHSARDAGFDNISIDLIFSLPTALNRDWERDLHRALALNPDHISLYGLTIEPATPLGRWITRGAVIESPDESYEAQFLLANALLVSEGYEHYEVSNFAKQDKRAVHNSAYWRGVPYLGVGPAAHGFDGSVRRWNEPAYASWLAHAEVNTDPLAGSEHLTPSNRITEGVYLGLRTRDGLDVTAADMPLLTPWIQAGWLEYPNMAAPTRVRCTPIGWLRLDGLASDLTALRSH